MVDFLINFGFLSSNIALLGPEKNLKSCPLIAKDIKKKRKKNPAFFSQKNFGYDFLDPQNGQNTDVNLAKNGGFLDPFSIFEL